MANSRPEIGRTCNKSSTSWAIRQKSAQSLGGSWIRNVGVWLAGVFPNVLKFASSVCLWFLVVYCLVVLSHSVCPALCARKNCSPPGSPDHGIFQARILEWIAISFSKRFFRPRDWTHTFCVSCTGRQILYHCAPGQPLIPGCVTPNET